MQVRAFGFRSFTAVLLLGLSATLFGQVTPPAPAAPPSSELPAAGSQKNAPITLHVVVSDRAGNHISGLQQQDFTLLDNKHPQTLLSFREVSKSAPAEPVEAILLVDAVNTAFTGVSYEREQIVKYLSQNGGKLPVPVSMIILTDTDTKMQSQATQDGNGLITSFNNYVTGLRSITRSTGIYGADDRLQLSLRALGQLTQYETARPGRKLVIWISPGWPILSGPRIELSNHARDGILRSVVDFSTGLRTAGITLYSVDPLGTNDAGSGRNFYYQNFLKGVRKTNEVQLGNLALQVLATQSGGLVQFASNDVASEIARAAADADSYYELTFAPQRADGPNDYHAIEVKTDKPGLTARTRTGYYAQP